MSDWQPINTIPRDGRPVYVRVKDFVQIFVGRCLPGCDVEIGALQQFSKDSRDEWTRLHPPTGWMPRPDIVGNRSKVAKRGLRNGSLVLLGVNGDKWVLENQQTKERLEFIQDLCPELFWFSKGLTGKEIRATILLKFDLDTSRRLSFFSYEIGFRKRFGYVRNYDWMRFLKKLEKLDIISRRANICTLKPENMKPKEVSGE